METSLPNPAHGLDSGDNSMRTNVEMLRVELARLKKLDACFSVDEFLPVLLGAIHEGGVFVYDRDGVILSTWLPCEMQARLGIDVAALRGLNIRTMHAVGAVDERLRLMDEALVTGRIQRHEYCCDMPGGRVWFETKLAPMRGSDGQIRYFISFFRDITRRKLAECSRDESEARYRGLVENSRDAIMLTRPDGIIEYMSPSTREVLGWRPEALMGIKPNIVHPEDQPRVRERFLSSLTGERGSDYEYRILTDTGDVRWISHSWAPIREHGEVKLVVSIVRDITDHKRIEQELREAERLATVGQTIADIAHQLKTICLNIRGSASLFEKALAENKLESLRTLWGVFLRSSDRLANLSLEMLEYAGIQTLCLGQVDLNGLLGEIGQDCQGKALALGVALRVAPEPALPCLRADAARLREALTNLTCNALEACEGFAGRTVELRSAWNEPAQTAEILVIDDGPGIPAEVLARIFDPFFTTKGAKGSGLGLAIARKAVQLHGGTISVESRLGQTIMRIALPIALSH